MITIKKKASLTLLSLLYLMLALPMNWISEQTFLTAFLAIIGMFKFADIAEKKVEKNG